MEFRYTVQRYHDRLGHYRYFFIDDNGNKWVVGSARYRYMWKHQRFSLEQIYNRFPEMIYIEPYKHKGTLDNLLVVEEPILFF